MEMKLIFYNVLFVQFNASIILQKYCKVFLLLENPNQSYICKSLLRGHDPHQELTTSNKDNSVWDAIYKSDWDVAFSDGHGGIVFRSPFKRNC